MYADKVVVLQEEIDELTDALEAAKVEIERLRDALDSAADALYDARILDAWAKARAALAGKE